MLLENLLIWLNQYGPIVLFVLLALGIIILPVPEEFMMFTAGGLIASGDLKLIPTVVAAILGAWCGITGSYFIGLYSGPYIIYSRLGKFLRLPLHLAQAKSWFTRIGKWSLTFGYFIPGVRHFTGYVAGSLALPYYQFSLFAYSGGLLWASLFLAFGYSSGSTVMEFLVKFWNALPHFTR